MNRITTKIGDIFCAKLDNRTKIYFQYIANDLTMLNSSVIKVLKKIYDGDERFSMEDVVIDEIDFYAHVVIEWGIEMELWEKVGNDLDVGKTDVLFRSTLDYGHKIGEEPIKISHNWRVWKINEPFKNVGKLSGENRRAEIGIVLTPLDIIDRMRTGKYHFVYPQFE